MVGNVAICAQPAEFILSAVLNVVLETGNKNVLTTGSHDSSFGVATRLRTGRSGVQLQGRTRDSSKRSDRLWEPPSFLFSGC